MPIGARADGTLSGHRDVHSLRARHSDGLRSRDHLESCTSSVAARSVVALLALGPLAVVVAALPAQLPAWRHAIAAAEL